MADYKLGPPVTGSIIRTSDGVSIPPDPANHDYQVYLAWLAAPNTPDPYVTPPPSFSSARNWLANPNFIVDQVGGTHQNLTDGGYAMDAWFALRQTADTVSLSANSLTGIGDAPNVYGSFLGHTSVTSQRIGKSQIIEYNDCNLIRGQPLTYSANLMTDTTINIRAAILTWDGTANAVTRDLVNDWTSTTYTTGNFFTSTSRHVVAVSAALACTANVSTRISVQGTSPITGPSNLQVFMWTEAVMPQNKFLMTWGEELAVGGLAGNTAPRAYVEELLLCQRTLEVANAAVYSAATAAANGVGNSYSYHVRKIASPTVTLSVGAVLNAYEDRVTYTNASDSATTITIKAQL